MMKVQNRWLWFALCLSLTWMGWLSAADSPRPDASKAPMPTLQGLDVFPKQLALRGPEDRAQILLTGLQAAGRPVDLTLKAKYSVSDPKLAQVTASGRVIPLANGKLTIQMEFGTHKAHVECQISHMTEELPINFANQITPIFTKLGCNSGGCHGKSGGQNGFHLSLLGFEPPVDYMALVKETRGRRLFPAAPEHSLLLRKGTGQMPHGGGKKLDADSDEYRVLRQWISAGMPWGDAKDPVVKQIFVTPNQRVLAAEENQQLVVLAEYTDGHVEDVTRRAQYESNETEIATVTPEGIVQIGLGKGQAAIMVRYQGQVTVFRALVPLEKPVPSYEYPQQTLVDGPVLKQFQRLNLMPSALSSDEQFLRRVTLDITGTLPTPDEVRAFVADSDPNKRNRWIDQLLERPEYAYFFANKWADILRVKRHGDARRIQGTFAFHEWIRQALAKDMPYDQFIREILTAVGDEKAQPSVVWYKEMNEFSNYVDDLGQVFLGQRLACANCHHHPFEKWSQDDYWGLAAFFGRVGKKQIPQQGDVGSLPNPKLSLFVSKGGSVANKRTGQAAAIKALDAPVLNVPPGEDPREKLVDWMVAPNNPFVAKAVVNRYWAHFFGRGIVDPPDDMRITNPASNEELLNALAQDFIANKFSLKHLVRLIAKSRTYQLSAMPNELNQQDKQNFARFYPRRMSAEVLLDAVNRATNFPDGFGGLPNDQHAPKRAIMLPDEAFTNYFLEVFGKPMRTSACECERVSDANLAQALHLLNSDEILNKIARGGGRADLLAQDKQKKDPQLVEELFLTCLARRPTDVELKVALDHITKLGPNQRKKAFENLLWAMINTKEFSFID